MGDVHGDIALVRSAVGRAVHRVHMQRGLPVHSVPGPGAELAGQRRSQHHVRLVAGGHVPVVRAAEHRS